MEHMDRGSLEFILKDYHAVSQAALAGIVYQILWGLAYLHHDNRIVSTYKSDLSVTLPLSPTSKLSPPHSCQYSIEI